MDAEVQRMRAAPRNIEMASNLDPPSLPWKESRWIHGPPGMRGAIGRGPQGDRGVLVTRSLPSGRSEIKMVRGRDTQTFDSSGDGRHPRTNGQICAIPHCVPA